MRGYPPYFVSGKGVKMDIITLDGLRRANRDKGKYWFSPETTRFFDSRYPSCAYKSGSLAYFITSERFRHDYPRLYTIRVCDLTTGGIDTVGEFQQYGTRQQAERALKKLLKTE